MCTFHYKKKQNKPSCVLCAHSIEGRTDYQQKNLRKEISKKESIPFKSGLLYLSTGVHCVFCIFFIFECIQVVLKIFNNIPNYTLIFLHMGKYLASMCLKKNIGSKSFGVSVMFTLFCTVKILPNVMKHYYFARLTIFLSLSTMNLLFALQVEKMKLCHLLLKQILKAPVDVKVKIQRPRK